MSNPCNPTGKVLRGSLLAEWVQSATKLGCALLMDEFYSHYIWVGDEPTISAARYVENVETDPIVIVDGLTKNWRYPGFRISWTLGPKRFIESVASAGSFLDGGACAPMQRAVIPLLEPEHVRDETAAIQHAFRQKRKTLLADLRAIGVHFDLEPEGTFYAWGDLRNLPPSLQSADSFFRAALDQRVICVPGYFFDVNPGKRRKGRASRFRSHIRFSFGPRAAVLREAVKTIAVLGRSSDLVQRVLYSL